MKNSLTQLYWPINCLNKEGYIVGWAVRGFTCCVITILNDSFEKIANSLINLGEKVEILGIVGKEYEVVEAKSQFDIWITAEAKEDSVLIKELYCCSYKYKADALIIYYDNNPLSKNPLSIFCPSVFHRESFNYQRKLKKPDLSTLQIVCEKINRTQFIKDKLLLEPHKKPLRSRSLFFPTQIILIMKELGEFIYTLYCFEIPVLKISIQKLPFRSIFIQQLISRLKLLRVFENTRKHLQPKYACPYLTRSYINSYIKSNSALYTILADFMFGIFLMILLSYYSTHTLLIVHTLGSTVHIEVLKSEVDWLMGLPAGFKPNEALDNAVGENILLLIHFWNYITTYLTKFEGEIVQFFAVFGLFGITFQLALLSDLIDFCTLHM